MNYILIIFFLFLLVSLYSKIYKQSSKKLEDIQKLTRQCSRWLVAAEQDKSPVIATLHVQYGMGYLWAIKDIASVEEFREATGLDFGKFETEAVAIQDEISKRIVEVCPEFSGDVNKYFASIAGEA